MNMPNCSQGLHVSLRLLGVALLVVVTATPATASVCPAPEIFGPIVNPHVEGSMIVWEPLVSYELLTLRVSAPCGDITRIFKEGETPFFDVREVTREVDGVYSYELVVQPQIDPAVAEQLGEVRGTPQEQFVVLELWDKGLLPRGPFRQSGSFQVSEGLILPLDSVEKTNPRLVASSEGLEARSPGSPGNVAGSSEEIRKVSAAGTVLTNADGIIRNSLCVGFDCPTSPTFSDTTILLMENNTRIKFDDTSTISGFPNRDWELQANSNSSGGGSYFAINDCGNSSQGGCAEDPLFLIEAGAPSNSIRVDNGGRVGFGTANPVVELHVVDGDTPTLRLQQDTSSGFAAQTWDVAGNETSFFVRDATNGSTLPFRIRPGASSNSLVIDTDDDVGVGTLSPSEALHVRRTNGSAKVLVEEASGTASQRTLMELENNGGVQFRMSDGSAAGGTGITWVFQNSGGNFTITDAGDGDNEMILSGAGDLTITGSLTVGPGGCTGCDLVFQQPELYVESIEEHASYMWENSHLPGIGPTPEDAPMNLSKKTGGILNELEKAHIYIEQLHNGLQQKDAQIQEVQHRVEELAALNVALQERIESLERRQ